MKLSIELDGIAQSGLDSLTGLGDPAAALGQPAMSAINAGPSDSATGGASATESFASAPVSGDRRDGGSPPPELLEAVAAAGAPAARENGTTGYTSGRSPIDAGGAPG